MSVPTKKRVLASLLAKTGLARACASAQTAFVGRRHIRVVNYHATPQRDLARFEEHLAFYRRRFQDVSLAELDRFFAEGRLAEDRPGLIISFDDGLRSNGAAVPLLDRYGFTGWFMVPSAFIDTDPSEQAEFALAHRIHPREDYEDGRVALSWEELRQLARNHVVCSHTATHRRMSPDLDDDVLRTEIIESRTALEQHLDRPVDVFCWVGPREHVYTARAAQVIREAGYRYAFMSNSYPITLRTNPHQLQRTNIEASWPLDVVSFQISGAMDLLYTRRRRWVNRLTA